MDTSRELSHFLTNWQKRFRFFRRPKKRWSLCLIDLLLFLSWEKLQNTSVGGRKNFPLVVLDDTLGDNLITWPLNLLWVKGDLTFWHRIQEVKRDPTIGGPYSKIPVPKKQLTLRALKSTKYGLDFRLSLRFGHEWIMESNYRIRDRPLNKLFVCQKEGHAPKTFNDKRLSKSWLAERNDMLHESGERVEQSKLLLHFQKSMSE